MIVVTLIKYSYLYGMKERQQQGGKRQGSGRPRQEPTQVIRVPYSLIDTVNAMIEAHKGKKARRKAQRVSNKVVAKKVSVRKTIEAKEVVYNCGCSLNGTLFRRANGCRLERLKH